LTKFDGGNDLAQHFPLIATATKALPAREAIIDAELVACSNSGLPNFYRLLSGKAEPYELCLWAFDLLHLNGRGLRLAHQSAQLARVVGDGAEVDLVPAAARLAPAPPLNAAPVLA